MYTNKKASGTFQWNTAFISFSIKSKIRREKSPFDLSFRAEVHQSNWYACCRRSTSWMTWPTLSIHAKGESTIFARHTSGVLLDVPHFGTTNAKLESGDGLTHWNKTLAYSRVASLSLAGWNFHCAHACKWKYLLTEFSLSSLGGKIACAERLIAGLFYRSKFASGETGCAVTRWKRRNLTVTERVSWIAPRKINATVAKAVMGLSWFNSFSWTFMESP